MKQINHRGRSPVSQSVGTVAVLTQFSQRWSVVKRIVGVLSQHILVLKVKKLESKFKEKQKWQNVRARHSFTCWETHYDVVDVNEKALNWTREHLQRSALWASSLVWMESFFSEVPWCGPRDHPLRIPHHESSCNSQTLYSAASSGNRHQLRYTPPPQERRVAPSHLIVEKTQDIIMS